jgi:hypothetical protein
LTKKALKHSKFLNSKRHFVPLSGWTEIRKHSYKSPLPLQAWARYPEGMRLIPTLFLCAASLLSSGTLKTAAPSATASLYRPNASAAQSSRPEDWELFIRASRAPDGAVDALLVKAELRRRNRGPGENLLLSVSASSQNGRSVSRRQVQLVWGRDQSTDTLHFRLDSPGCGPARVIAALFRGRTPLARAERTLRFPCENPLPAPSRTKRPER